MLSFIFAEIPGTVFPLLLFQMIYDCCMSALIAQFFAVAVDFINKSKTFEKSNNAQRSYYRGLGYFFFAIVICQILYLIVAINEELYPNNIPPQIFKTDADYDITSGGTPIHIFRSFYVFADDKFVITFFLLFLSLPFLTYSMEKYVFAQKSIFLTYLCIGIAPLIILVRVFEMFSDYWFGQSVLEMGTDVGNTTSLGLVFTFFWIFLMLILFLIVIL